MTDLTADLAARFARLTLGHIGREYPQKLDHVMTGPADVRSPRTLHPIFHGSFDWHSCVHGWWQLMRLAHLFPSLTESQLIVARAREMFTPGNVQVELDYMKRPASAGFERPYGWGWLLALHTAAAAFDAEIAARLAPMAGHVAQSLRDYLPRLTYPIRAGVHSNTSFALILAFDWARHGGHDPALAELIRARARDWFVHDRNCQAWEPDGDAFLSPALTEALLMSRVLPAEGFRAWFGAFLPDIAQGSPASLLTPAEVSDRSDGKIAHLDGLNLSRAWCWRGIARALGSGPAAAMALRVAGAHVDASMPHLADDYAGEHWLASFALLALGEG
ncbi:DUF2891 domain-containing protein [Sphingomonas sp.]|uniref:DUF2891 domain-containing protein n=1 Tax=Sphingomonas sp. TaxID=28214 RepID=UPI001DC2B4C7|nr:DUF2891 domain-containing protein [Sphingomonas sp.]MBX9797273.1 DUF2891 domain-containing protein [Sphingomonas sp.]